MNAIQAQQNAPRGTECRNSDASAPRAATRAVRAALGTDTQHGAVVPPLWLSTNFTFDGFDSKRPYDYTRSGNPTRSALADALTRLEGLEPEDGAGAIVTSSGMAALTLITQLLEPGDLLLAPHDCYGGTWRLFDSLSKRGAFRVLFVDQTDPAALAEAFSEQPRLVLVETPSNPLLRITDLERVASQARGCGAILAVDNTFLSPALQQPFEYGADLVVHSTTKYLNGHSDVVGGAVIARSPELVGQLDFWSNCLGLTGAPFDSYLTLRGVRTLHARWRQHETNAREIVKVLSRHPAVARVYHPSLPEHPGHEIALRQQKGFGAMVSFELAGDTANVAAFVEGLECFSLAESLGGVESLVAHPATMTHASMAPEQRRVAGIEDTLIRVSVGIEDEQDLVEDLVRGLERARLVGTREAVAV